MGNLKNRTATCIFCGKDWLAWRSDSNIKFCCRECQHEYNYQDYISKWLLGITDGSRGETHLSKHVIRWVFERACQKCEKCGFDELHPRTNSSILEVHHVDENPINNRPENLILLCPNCHALTDSRDSKKGNGRRYYRSQYHLNKEVR